MLERGWNNFCKRKPGKFMGRYIKRKAKFAGKY
jgi:hypothetical protein